MSADIALVLSHERLRCRLLEEGDAEAVAELLDDELVYVHSTGVVHTHADLMNFLRGGIRYQLVRRRALRAVPAGDAVLLTGFLRIEGRRAQGAESFGSSSFVSQIWTPATDPGWKLRLFQSTRVPDELWESAQSQEDCAQVPSDRSG
jgi:ketosteroid isomerase-like protein